MHGGGYDLGHQRNNRRANTRYRRSARWRSRCRSRPDIRAWAEKYKDQGFVVIGVHAPEFAFEKNVENVKQAVAGLKID